MFPNIIYYINISICYFIYVDMVIYLEINFINMEGTLSNYCLDKYDFLRDTSIF